MPPQVPTAARLITALAAILLCGAHIALSTMANNGHFIYALDDPYIHLDLAEQFARTGVYGVNEGIASSPSSSILWPFLLVPFATFEWLTYVPLLLNLLAVAFAASILPEIVTRCALRKLALPLLTAISFAAVLLLNLPALALMGMEHGAHVAVALVMALGVLRVFAGERAPSWLWLAIIISPLLRYEGAIISALALALLFLHGQQRKAIATAVVVAVGVGAFSLFLLSLGLDALPNSTIVKKVGHVGGLSAYLDHWMLLLYVPFYLGNTLGILLILAVPAVLVFTLVRLGTLTRQQLLVLAAAFLGFSGHMILGRYSNIEIYRYEYYQLGFLAPLLAYAGRGWLSRPYRFALSLAVLCCWLSPMLYSSLWGIQRSTIAIYEQHYALGDAAQNYWRAPVAVNDIGLVGYSNPSFVLDLWGLGDSEVLHARRAGEPDWLMRLLARHNVKLVMLNAQWWDTAVLAQLIRVGELRRLTSSALANDVVTFYATDPAYIPEITEKLIPWVRNLPDGSSFSFTVSTNEDSR